MTLELKNVEAANHGYIIILISKHDCVQCEAAKRKLDDRKVGETESGPEAIAYYTVNAEDDESPHDEFDGHSAFDYVTGIKKVRQMPYLIVKHADQLYDDEWSGLRPDKLSPLVRNIKAARANDGNKSS